MNDFREGDTQPIDVTDILSQLPETIDTETNPHKIIESAIIHAGRQQKILSTDQGVLFTDFESIATPEIQEVTNIILEKWETISRFAIQAHMAITEKSTQHSELLYDDLVSDFEGEGLTTIVKKLDTKGPTGTVYNPTQLEIHNNSWVLAVDKEYLEDTFMRDTQVRLTKDMIHEFFAWRLFSKDQIIPHIEDKISQNKQILTIHQPTLQTLFFDDVFSELITGYDRQEWRK